MAAKNSPALEGDISLQQAFPRMTLSTSSETGKDLNLLIVGKTGVGKSSTGNSILGRKVFKSKKGDVGVTRTIQMAVGRVMGHEITVVDCPGLMEPTLSEPEGLQQFFNALMDTIMDNPTGFNAILVVTELGQRLTKEDREVFKRLKLCFGENCLKKYGILVVTHEDDFDKEENEVSSLHEFFDRQTGFLKEMKDGCGGRLVTFDNKSKDSGVLTRQRELLFDMVKQITQREGHYTQDIFSQFRAEREKELLKLNMANIRDETNHKLKFIIEDFRNWHESSSDVSELEGFKSRLIEIRQSLVQQDKGTGVLEQIISSVKHMEDSVTEKTVDSSKIDNLKMNLDRQQQLQKKFLVGAGFAAAISVGALIASPHTAVGVKLAAEALMGDTVTAASATEIASGALMAIPGAAVGVKNLLAGFAEHLQDRKKLSN